MFFGYSDITNLHLYFHRAFFNKHLSTTRKDDSRFITFYGGAVLCQFGIQGTIQILHNQDFDLFGPYQPHNQT